MIIWCHQSGSSMVTAVDAVLVLHVSPARSNTKCRHSAQQILFVPLSMNPSALDISISTINPYHNSFFINSPFLWNNICTNLLQITNRKLSALHFGTFFFNLYYLTYCFCTCLCCTLYMLLFCILYVLLFWGACLQDQPFVQPLSLDENW